MIVSYTPDGKVLVDGIPIAEYYQSTEEEIKKYRSTLKELRQLIEQNKIIKYDDKKKYLELIERGLSYVQEDKKCI